MKRNKKELGSAQSSRLAPQGQFVLPILDCLDGEGGRSRTADLCDAVAVKMGVDEETRREVIEIGGRRYNRFDHRVRWAQQQARALSLCVPAGKATWELTGKGKEALHRAAPGLVVTIFTTADGIALYGRAEEAVAHIDDGSVRLLFTSPPYPLLREKQYSNKAANEYVEWLLRIAETWPRKLARDGSVVLNLGDVMNRGEPTYSLYQERLLIRLEDELGWKLCQRFAWQNPSKLPSPAEWVTIKRVRVKGSLEQLYWLAPNDMPYADNRQVLVPYSDSMLNLLARGGQRKSTRPSGHQQRDGAFSIDNGGAIPGNLLTMSNTVSNDPYQRGCREASLPVHPARAPAGMSGHFIRLCTEVGDTVFDPFSGSFQTGAEAESLGRKWVGSELHLEYIAGGAIRFPGAKIHQPQLLHEMKHPASLF
ncbi:MULTISPECIES: site-specific DNA-methyltransferase [Burkholderia]|uniref:Methyltransferase n=2 Tax=Burkholderia cepacia complex TaxID=87882 RepID=A0AAP1V519_9BURK|nr:MULTISPECIES: site-specific DNA-methyltransferase [Burkholderia]MBK1901984.1 site-specific DNA-methyltransferase [Burkholderia contaminans]MBK1910267.1 site-specific DNA-methyltransferase [Burkholderia contaminans]MBK1923726.1 site-specific DNA-methyltransferase [Burkholderia contaminans]MBK1931938.1 site-specific DNA-methyltransferase [Burkholderia contaminans]MBK1939187.1 site-specific DNA-methyltransferase [Burkholderia contaminans]